MSSAEPTHSGTAQKPGAGDRGRDARTPYMAIYVLLAAAFIAILNETIMSVAIPVIKTDLDISAALAQWVTTAFLLTMAVVIPVTGFLISKLTLRQLFLLSQGLFVAGTVIGALIIGVLNNGLNLMNVNSFWQYVVKGIVILLAVYVDYIRNRKKQ